MKVGFTPSNLNQRFKASIGNTSSSPSKKQVDFVMDRFRVNEIFFIAFYEIRLFFDRLFQLDTFTLKYSLTKFELEATTLKAASPF